MNPLLGRINPADRTAEQNAAHARAMAGFHRHALPRQADPPKGTKIVLTQAFKDRRVVADIGYEFTGYRQLTGSCVGVSSGNAVATVSAVQRLLAANPTKALAPWWPFPYGRTRANEGDVGPGEGAVDSVMAATLIKEGVFSSTEQGLPAFDTSDGLAIAKDLELQWSDGASPTVTKWESVAKQHPLGSAAVVGDTTAMRDMILNGYPILDGCDNFIGAGAMQGSGSDAVAVGAYDNQGGHSTCYVGFWDHPTLGPLFLYWNQWAGSTYPDDGSGKPRCSVWTTEANAAKLFRTGGGGGETVALSHLSYFPAQPALQKWAELDPWQ